MKKSERYVLAIVSSWLALVAAWLWPIGTFIENRVESIFVHAACYWPILFLAVSGIYWLTAKATRGETESKNVAYISRLDHLRFFAAALVVLYHHYSGWVGDHKVNPVLTVFREGSRGVELFFVLSGFIFGVIGYEKKIRYLDFIFSRLVRIFPLYIFAIILVVAQNPDRYGTGQFVLLLFPIFDVNFLTLLPNFGQLWSVALEFQFYLLFPFISTFIARNGYRYLLGLSCLFLIIRAVYFAIAGSVVDLSQWSLLGRLDQFFAGILAAYLYLKSRDKFASVIHLILSGALVFASFQWLAAWGGYTRGASSPMWIFWPLIEGLVWGYFTLSYLSSSYSLPKAIDRSLARLGQLSFSIYVMHTIAMQWIAPFLGRHKLTGHIELDVAIKGVFVSLPLACCLAFLTYNLIEKQFFIFRRKYVEPLERVSSRQNEPAILSPGRGHFWPGAGLAAVAAVVAVSVLYSTELRRRPKLPDPIRVDVLPAASLPLQSVPEVVRVSITGFWKIDGISESAPKLPINGIVYGSWHGDESTGKLVLGPVAIPRGKNRKLAIPIVVGPRVAGLSLALKDATDGKVICQFPLDSIVSHNWSAFVADLSPLASERELVLEAVDGGTNWGQWFAIGSVRWVP